MFQESLLISMFMKWRQIHLLPQLELYATMARRDLSAHFFYRNLTQH
jgi:hypothetical protein